MAALISSASATGSGTMTLAGPSTNSNQTITIPDATGTMMVSGNMPAFSAYLSAGQSGITSSTSTKIAFDSEEFDTNNNFASSRFTPTVGGYYQINGVMSGGGTFTRAFLSIYKNGSEFKRGNDLLVSGYAVTVSSIIYLNGSTDYIELYGWLLGTGLSFSSGATNGSYFNGCLLRAA